MKNAEITLFHMPQSRSAMVVWLLEEMGIPYKVKFIHREPEKRDPELKKLNPMGKVPTLIIGETVLTETPAICFYLAEKFPQTKLEIPPGDPLRGDYLKWLFFAHGCLEPAIIEKMFKRDPIPEGSAGWGNLDRCLDLVKNRLGEGPYFLGENFTLVDILLGSLLRWGYLTRSLPKIPELKNYLTHLEKREALARSLKMEKFPELD